LTLQVEIPTTSPTCTPTSALPADLLQPLDQRRQIHPVGGRSRSRRAPSRGSCATRPSGRSDRVERPDRSIGRSPAADWLELSVIDTGSASGAKTCRASSSSSPNSSRRTPSGTREAESGWPDEAACRAARRAIWAESDGEGKGARSVCCFPSEIRRPRDAAAPLGKIDRPPRRIRAAPSKRSGTPLEHVSDRKGRWDHGAACSGCGG